MEKYTPTDLPDKNILDEVIAVLESHFEVQWTQPETKIENGVKL